MRRVPAVDEKPLHWVASSKRDFLSFPGIACFAIGVMLLGPVFGILLYYVSKPFYAMRKARRGGVTVSDMIWTTWTANALCLPIILLVSWQAFTLFYGGYDSLVKIYDIIL